MPNQDPVTSDAEGRRVNPHRNLLASLRRSRYIVSDRVYSVMLSVDRGHYTGRNPYVDASQVLGWNSVISAPSAHAMALESLSGWLQPGAQVLDVGSGSGYMTSCMGLMVKGSGGHVTGVDHIEELVALAQSNIRRSQPTLISEGHVDILCRDARFVREMMMYDVIHIGALAPAIPKALKVCLKVGGRMLIALDEAEPLKEQPLYTIDKRADGKCMANKIGAVNYTRLCDSEEQVGHISG